jgi:uncharacterized repeat protein (TIGR01451 family)
MGNQVQYQRGPLTEWYLPSTLGIEQGFTLTTSPKGSDKLVLRLRLTGNLQGTAASDGRGASFRTPDGRTVHYDSLRAYDANGRELDAKMLINAGQILIQVDDANAKYPITIDPLIYLEDQVITSDAAANDEFGISVAVSGDTAIIGAYNKTIGSNSNQGAAYVFTRSGTTWSQQQELTASDGAANDEFGNSVAVSGDTAVIGASTKTVGSNGWQGAAYVFTRSGTIWSQQQKLTASDGWAGDLFGDSVAVSGGTALIGAYYKSVGSNSWQGAVYVFTRSGTIWSQQQELTASDGVAFDHFGNLVAISGDTAVIGAYEKTVGSNSNQGAAYVFTRSGTTWSQQQELAESSSDGQAYDKFGNSVAINGNTAVIGAMYKIVGSNGNQGAAYVFTRSGTIWSQQQELTASDGAADDRFGGSVAVSGDTAVIGAAYKTVGSNSNQGAAYVFTYNGTAWSQQKELTASDGAYSDEFGSSVAFDGVAVVGAYQNTLGSLTNAGSAYICYPYSNNTDLMVNQAVNAATPDAGQAITYTVTVTNLGPNSASGVAVFDKLPSGVTYTSSLATSSSYDPLGGSWNLTTLAVGASATLVINATVNSGTAGQTITNTASLVGLDTNLTDNTASTTLNVTKPVASLTPAVPAFLFEPVGTPAPVVTVTLTNTGTGHLKVSAISFTGNFASAGTGTCTTSTVLAPSANCTIKITFTPTALGTRTGTLTVTSNGFNSPTVLSLSGKGAKNVVTNGGMEIDTVAPIGIPDGWTAVNMTVSSTADGLTTTVFHSGKKSMRIVGSTGKTKTLTQTITDTGSVNLPLRLTLWAKGNAVSTTGAYQAIVQLYVGTTLSKTFSFNLPTGTYAFTQETFNMTSTVAYTKLTVQFLSSKPTGSTLWIDDVSLVHP